MTICREHRVCGLSSAWGRWLQKAEGTSLLSSDGLWDHNSRLSCPQTKKKRPSRRVNAEESDIPVVTGEDQMQVDEKPIVPRPRNLDANFVDDDELQAALARSRRAKLQKRKKLSPEEIAKQSTYKCCLPP